MLPYAKLADTDRRFQKCSSVRGAANRRRVRHAQRAGARQAARKEIQELLCQMAEDEWRAWEDEWFKRELELDEFYDFETDRYYGYDADDHELVWHTGVQKFGEYMLDMYSNGSMMYLTYRIFPITINDETIYEVLEGNTYMDRFESVESCCRFIDDHAHLGSAMARAGADFMAATGYNYADEVYTLWA